MSNIVNLIGDNDAFESEEALKRVYGEDAVFSKVGVFTLVHLDHPTPETIARRTGEFDPREFFMDDCPLCEMSRRDGGHIVFNSDPYDDAEEEEFVSEYNAEHEAADQAEVDALRIGGDL